VVSCIPIERQELVREARGERSGNKEQPGVHRKNRHT
jgi:hypothetical protein